MMRPEHGQRQIRLVVTVGVIHQPQPARDAHVFRQAQGDVGKRFRRAVGDEARAGLGGVGRQRDAAREQRHDHVEHRVRAGRAFPPPGTRRPGAGSPCARRPTRSRATGPCPRRTPGNTSRPRRSTPPDARGWPGCGTRASGRSSRCRARDWWRTPSGRGRPGEGGEAEGDAELLQNFHKGQVLPGIIVPARAAVMGFFRGRRPRGVRGRTPSAPARTPRRARRG